MGAGVVVGVSVVVELRHGGRGITARVVGSLRGPVLLQEAKKNNISEFFNHVDADY